MFYFDEEKNIEAYIDMAQGFDGKALIQILKEYLPGGASVLELGMGSGKDLDLLKPYYQGTGTDRSVLFVERYLKTHPDADVFQLDAIGMTTTRTFDCIYSNKVLHHLTKEECIASFKNQKKNLTPEGILFHSFWYGNKSETYDGLLFNYYQEEDLQTMASNDYELIKMERYTEMEENDSIYIILKMK